MKVTEVAPVSTEKGTEAKQDLYHWVSDSDDYYYRPRHHHRRVYDDRSYRDYSGAERSDYSSGEGSYYHDDDHHVYVGSDRSYSEEPHHY